MSGCMVVDGATVVLTHLEEMLKGHAGEILGLQDVTTMLDHLRQQSPALVEEVVPKVASVSDVHGVLTSLLRERVPIRDLPRILTSLAVHAPRTKDPEELTELTRQALARSITAQYVEDDQSLWVCALDPAVEAELLARAQGGTGGAGPEGTGGLDADWMERLVRAVKRQMERLAALGHTPVILCGPAARPLLRALLERRAPSAVVLSHAEIATEAKVKSVGLVELAAPAEDGTEDGDTAL